MEEEIILVLDGEESEEKYIDMEWENFKNKPLIECERCHSTYQIKKETNFYHQLITGEDYVPSGGKVTLPFWQCCKECRAEESCYFDVAILADHMIEYISADKQWFFDEVHIEKRWLMTREEIEERAREMRKPLDYIL